MAATIAFNGAAIPVRERVGPTGIEYAFDLTIPETSDEVTVIAHIGIVAGSLRPRVHVKNAPDCRRHRWPDHSLCMWLESDGPDRKWTVDDGLDALAVHVARHLFQEAVCRAGDSWPGEESPGEHPRRPDCRTCGGEGD